MSDAPDRESVTLTVGSRVEGKPADVGDTVQCDAERAAALRARGRATPAGVPLVDRAVHKSGRGVPLTPSEATE